MTPLSIHESNNLHILVFNVGQGDHILIKFPDSSYGIIDFHFAGKRKGQYSQLEPPVLRYFRKLREELDYDLSSISIRFVHLSHTHLDHIKGCTQTLEFFRASKIRIEKFLLPATDTAESYIRSIQEICDRLAYSDPTIIKVNNQWDKELKSIEEFRFRRTKPIKESVYEVHKYFDWSIKKSDLKIMSFGPTDSRLKKVKQKELTKAIEVVLKRSSQKIEEDSDETGLSDSERKLIHDNLLSSLLWIKWRRDSVLFTGDIDLKVWEQAIKNFYDKKYEKEYSELSFKLIKLSHHGSKSSSSKNLWKKLIKTNGSMFVASAGYNLQYNHPNSETIQDLKATSQESCILSTNTCRKCIEKCDATPIDLACLSSDNRINDVDLLMNTEKSTPRENDSKPGLFGILYTLGKSAEVSSEVLISNAVPTLDKCFFLDHDYSPDNCYPVKV